VQTLLSEPEGYELLKNAGIPVPSFKVVRTSGEAMQAADFIGYPVVMKVISPQVIHKSDAGGVVTGIRSSSEAVAAYDVIVRNVQAFNPATVITGIMVEQQKEPGLELIIGGKTDPTFGKVLTVGFGGILVELIKDVSIRVLPVTDGEIREMLHELKGYRLIAGYRHGPALDEDALLKIIVSIARMFGQSPRITEFDINPLFLYETGACAVDARFYEDPEARLPEIGKSVPDSSDLLLNIRSIAVVGASQDPNKVGYAVCRNLLSFPGELSPVTPKAPDILGRVAYPTLTAIPGPVDAAVIVVPVAAVPGVIEEAGKKKIPLAIIITSGFREVGPAGAVFEKQVLDIAKKYGMRIMGPNCLGLMLPRQGINTTFDPVSPKPGSIAFISQSGAIITTIVDWSLPEEIGFSAVISVGNQADLTFEDFIRFVGDDPGTKAIILYVEQVLDGPRFMEIARRLTPKKPIIAIKSGSSRIGQKAASTHTGSLAGSYEVYMAAFRQAGIIPVLSLREAFQTAELLSSEGYPKGKRAVVISNAGGFAVLSSDYAERFGIEIIRFSPDLVREFDAVLPSNWSRENPIDMVGDANADRFARAFDILIQHQDVWDIAVVVAVPSAISNPLRVANEIVRFSKHTRKMIMGCMIGGDSMKTPLRILRDAAIPNFSDLEDAFRSAGSVSGHSCTNDSTECVHRE
jgi:acetyl coenzyme A synthetase (ADP forming)-like protein